MFPLLVAIVWLVVVAFFVLLCRAAARGDGDFAAVRLWAQPSAVEPQAEGHPLELLLEDRRARERAAQQSRRALIRS